MSTFCKRFGRLLAWPAAALLLGGVAGAQEPTPAPPTSPVPAPSSAGPAAEPVSQPASAAKPLPKSTAQSEAGEPRATTGLPRPATPSRAPSATTPKAPGAADRLDLNTATVTGDREQPKVMYIVPWKRADIGDLSGKPMNSLLDEALAPVDRDEFKREVMYYDAMNDAAPHNGASKAGEPGEK